MNGREQQTKLIIEALNRHSNVFIYGTTGSGKSFTISSLLSESCMIDCSIYRTTAAIISQILIKNGIPTHRIITRDWLIETLTNILERRNITVVLDNAERIDRHSKSDVIFSLCSLPKKPALIVIAKNKSFLRKLDRRAASRFFPAIVEFKPYSAGELYDIIKNNANDVATALIAWEASKTGDCRLAMKMVERFHGTDDVKDMLNLMEGIRL